VLLATILALGSSKSTAYMLSPIASFQSPYSMNPVVQLLWSTLSAFDKLEKAMAIHGRRSFRKAWLDAC
jgi:hypothetical protein